MRQEYKDVLLQDLCARLPYKVKTQISDEYEDYRSVIESIDIDGFVVDFEGVQMAIEYLKPYLFPLSSMTEEQKKELHDKLIELELKALNDEISRIEAVSFEIDYYLKNHFDYRGLIEKGLAIDATGLNIYKEKTK